MATVLCVDDDKVFRRLLAAELTRRGHSVLQAGTASEADKLIARERLDLLLIDGLLPDMTGVAWLEKLRAGGCETKVLFVTSFWKAMRDFELVTKMLGVVRLLRKPLRVTEVADSIDAALSVEGPGANVGSA